MSLETIPFGKSHGLVILDTQGLDVAYVALMVFVCALFLLVTAFRTSHNDLMVVGISWVDPTGTLQVVSWCDRTCASLGPMDHNCLLCIGINRICTQQRKIAHVRHLFLHVPWTSTNGFVGYVRSLVLRGAVVHVLILAITAASNWKKSPSTRSDLRYLLDALSSLH